MNENETGKSNDPEAACSGSKKITFSASFEAAENMQIDYWAGLTPEQRFSHFYELMNRFYTFSKPDWKEKQIIIDS